MGIVDRSWLVFCLKVLLLKVLFQGILPGVTLSTVLALKWLPSRVRVEMLS